MDSSLPLFLDSRTENCRDLTRAAKVSLVAQSAAVLCRKGERPLSSNEF
jgi:hypothetical protein